MKKNRKSVALSLFRKFLFALLWKFLFEKRTDGDRPESNFATIGGLVFSTVQRLARSPLLPWSAIIGVITIAMLLACRELRRKRRKNRTWHIRDATSYEARSAFAILSRIARYTAATGPKKRKKKRAHSCSRFGAISNDFTANSISASTFDRSRESEFIVSPSKNILRYRCNFFFF